MKDQPLQNGKGRSPELPASMDAVPAFVLEHGFALYRKARTRAEQKNISVRAALHELAEELPDPLRSAALEALRDAELRAGEFRRAAQN